MCCTKNEIFWNRMMYRLIDVKKVFFIFIIGFVLLGILIFLLPRYLIKLNTKLLCNYTEKIVLDLRLDDSGGHGLGNQFFMLAFAYSAAKKYGISNILINNSIAYKDHQENFSDTSNRSYALNKFGINYPVMYDFNNLTKEEKSRSFKIKNLKHLQTIISLSDLKFKSKPHIIIIPPIFEEEVDVYYTYFKDEEKNLKNIFKYNQKLSSTAKDLLEEIYLTNSVGIHIRRGDYIPLKWDLSLDYYIKALDLLITKLGDLKLFIFTDDLNYVKYYFKDQENLKKVSLTNQANIARIYQLLNNSIYVSEKLNHSLEEFHLMSNCKHNIIANSTFSFSAAFLNNNPNKIVIFPQSYARYVFGRSFPEKNWLSIIE